MNRPIYRWDRTVQVEVQLSNTLLKLYSILVLVKIYIVGSSLVLDYYIDINSNSDIRFLLCIVYVQKIIQKQV